MGVCRSVAVVVLMFICHCYFDIAPVKARPAPLSLRRVSDRPEFSRPHHSYLPERFFIPQKFRGARKLAFLVEEPPLVLEYHNGPIMSGTGVIPVYMIWYGNFSETQRFVVRDLVSSFEELADVNYPSVRSWWNLTMGYKDIEGVSIRNTMRLAGEVSDGTYSKGRTLKNSDLELLVVDSLSTFASDPNAVYIVLTAEDVDVEDFCMNSCASHFSTNPAEATGGKQLPYIWVGNAATRCAGRCAWPYAKAEYGPNTPPLLAPNGDIGMDGLVMNLGYMLAGTATNPFNNGFFQGDAASPLEAATACTGMYGAGAYSGYPGKLLVDPITGASYNVNGANGRKFLLPALWDPDTLLCTVPISVPF